MKGKWFDLYRWRNEITSKRGGIFSLIVFPISRNFCIQDPSLQCKNFKINVQSNQVSLHIHQFEKFQTNQTTIAFREQVRYISRDIKIVGGCSGGQVTVSIAFRVIYEWTALACNRRAGVGCLRAFPCVSSSGDATEKGGSRIGGWVGMAFCGQSSMCLYAVMCYRFLARGPAACAHARRCVQFACAQLCEINPLPCLFLSFFLSSSSFLCRSSSSPETNFTRWQFHEVDDDRRIIGLEFFVRVEDAFVLERRAESLRRHVGLGKLGETWGVYVYGYRLEGIVGWGRLVINQIN